MVQAKLSMIAEQNISICQRKKRKPLQCRTYKPWHSPERKNEKNFRNSPKPEETFQSDSQCFPKSRDTREALG